MLHKSEYDAVFKQSKKIVTSEFVVLHRVNTFPFARLGLALSKRMIPKAHDRNRVKRIVRESFRRAKLPGLDVVVLARPGLMQCENLTLKINQVWTDLLKKCAA